MSDIVIRIAAGVAGAAIFAAINNYFLMLATGYSYLGGASVFACSFAIAYLVQRFTQGTRGTPPKTVVASENKSGGKMKVEVAGVSPPPGCESVVGSQNQSTGDMSISVKNKQQ